MSGHTTSLGVTTRATAPTAQAARRANRPLRRARLDHRAVAHPLSLGCPPRRGCVDVCDAARSAGEGADRELQEIFKLGRRSERWINLFGQHKPLVYAHPARSIDSIIDNVESVVREQYQKGKTTEEGRSAIEEALEKMRRAQNERGSVEE